MRTTRGATTHSASPAQIDPSLGHREIDVEVDRTSTAQRLHRHLDEYEDELLGLRCTGLIIM